MWSQLRISTLTEAWLDEIELSSLAMRGKCPIRFSVWHPFVISRVLEEQNNSRNKSLKSTDQMIQRRKNMLSWELTKNTRGFTWGQLGVRYVLIDLVLNWSSLGTLWAILGQSFMVASSRTLWVLVSSIFTQFSNWRVSQKAKGELTRCLLENDLFSMETHLVVHWRNTRDLWYSLWTH